MLEIQPFHGAGGDQNDPSLSMGQIHNTLQNISTGPNHSQGRFPYSIPARAFDLKNFEGPNYSGPNIPTIYRYPISVS